MDDVRFLECQSIQETIISNCTCIEQMERALASYTVGKISRGQFDAAVRSWEYNVTKLKHKIGILQIEKAQADLERDGVKQSWN